MGNFATSHTIASLVEEDRPICYGVLKPGDYYDQGVPLVRIVDLEGDKIEEDHLFRISPALDRQFIRSKLNGGELLLSIQGTIGRVAITPQTLNGANISRTIARLAIKPEHSASFIRFVLLSEPGQRLVREVVMGTTRDSLNIGALRKIEIDLPHPIAQTKIAEILSTVDGAIEQTEALIAKCQQIKAGLMQDLFTRGITPDGHLRPTRAQAPHLYKESPLGWIPKEWGIVRVEDLCMDVVDCPHSTPTYMTSGVSCIRTADMQPGVLLLDQAYRVSEEEYRERVARLVPQEGDIIYSREGERLGIASPVGRERVCLGQRVMLMRPTCKTNPDFLLWSMNTPGFYRRILAGLGATTSPHINVGDIRKALLVQPSSAEQDLSGALLARCSRLVRAEQAQLAKLRQVKHGLMQDLLTGRVRVKVGEAGAQS